MTALRYSIWLALVLAVILAIFSAGAGQWLLVGTNALLAVFDVALLYATRRR